MHWYVESLKKYATCGGRAGRKEYWYFFLFNSLVYIGLGIIDGVTGTFGAESGIGLLSGLYCVATLLPGLAVAVRRLHDTNRSGWWLLLGLVPVIGAIVLLIFLVQDGQPETNPYGANPKTADERIAQAPHTFGTAPGGPSQSDRIGQLERLVQLRDRGALTEREFEEQKAKLLS